MNINLDAKAKFFEMRTRFTRTCDTGISFCESLKIITGDKILPLNVVHAAFKFGASFAKAANSLSAFTSKQIDPKEWISVPQVLLTELYQVICLAPNSIIFMNEQQLWKRYHVHKGLDIVIYCANSATNSENDINSVISAFYHKEQGTNFKTFVTQAITSKHSLITNVAYPYDYNKGRRTLDIQPVKMIDVLYDSEEFESIYLYSKRFIDAGKSRAIMLYGPPGTGKTTISRMLVKKLNLPTMIIMASDLGNCFSFDAIQNLISNFKPSAIIIDDFDKGSSDYSVTVLQILEYLKQNCKLVITTANYITNMLETQKPLARPGRIDKFIVVDKLDKKFVLDMLGQELADQYEVVKHWPAAFLSEFRDIYEVLGRKEAIDSIPELNERVILNFAPPKKNDKNDDDDDDEPVSEGQPVLAGGKPAPAIDKPEKTNVLNKKITVSKAARTPEAKKSAAKITKTKKDKLNATKVSEIIATIRAAKAKSVSKTVVS